MFTIDFNDHTNLVKGEWYHQIEDLINLAKEKENIHEDAGSSVTFADKDEIQEINKNYRDKDKMTDVTSLAFGEDEPDTIGLDIPRVLGDIIVCTDVAKEQIEFYNHSFERELNFLALHGFLHLLGYDHMNEEDEKEMFGHQREILNAYRLTRD